MNHISLISAAQIGEMVRVLAQGIDSDSHGPLLVLTVLKGAALFSSDLVRALETDTRLEYITASSYRTGFIPDEDITLEGDPIDCAGRDVLVVDDIIDTGRTLRSIVERIQQDSPHRTRTVALVNKTGRRTETFDATYSGFEIKDEFIYGYGLDWDQKYRDLPFIAQANL